MLSTGQKAGDQYDSNGAQGSGAKKRDVQIRKFHSQEHMSVHSK